MFCPERILGELHQRSKIPDTCGEVRILLSGKRCSCLALFYFFEFLIVKSVFNKEGNNFFLAQVGRAILL